MKNNGETFIDNNKGIDVSDEEIVPVKKTKIRIHEYDWYVGDWECESTNYDSFDSKVEISFSVKKNGDSFIVEQVIDGVRYEGILKTKKIFLPDSIPESEKANYDSRDYIVADFGKTAYWIGITYDGDEEYDKISLNVDDIDVYRYKRKK